MNVGILVVDDEPDVAELFRQQFRRETRQRRYAFHYATSGAEALDWLALEIEPALVAVLSDINMPVMMVTAYGDDERRRRAAEHGAAAFLAKPIDFERLKTQLRELPSALNRGNVP